MSIAWAVVAPSATVEVVVAIVVVVVGLVVVVVIVVVIEAVVVEASPPAQATTSSTIPVRIAILVRMAGNARSLPAQSRIPGIGSGHAMDPGDIPGSSLWPAAAIAIVGFFLVRRSFPQIDGEIVAVVLSPVPSRSLEITEDGVPSYLCGQRARPLLRPRAMSMPRWFWQMDFWRHIGAGRLSEMFGDSQVDTDLFLRSLDFTGIAEGELEMLDSD